MLDGWICETATESVQQGAVRTISHYRQPKEDKLTKIKVCFTAWTLDMELTISYQQWRKIQSGGATGVTHNSHPLKPHIRGIISNRTEIIFVVRMKIKGKWSADWSVLLWLAQSDSFSDLLLAGLLRLNVETPYLIFFRLFFWRIFVIYHLTVNLCWNV